MAGVSGAIDGRSHIPNILRKDAPKIEELVLTDVVTQDRECCF